jgi:hypothetical protein
MWGSTTPPAWSPLAWPSSCDIRDVEEALGDGVKVVCMTPSPCRLVLRADAEQRE